MNIRGFWRRWFRPELGGRELGAPSRVFLVSPDPLPKLIGEAHRSGRPVYLSVQPYRARGKPCFIEKLFFDFDAEGDPGKACGEAFGFAESLRRFYGCEPLLVASGMKGVHIYVWLQEPIPVSDLGEARRLLRRLQEALIEGLSFETLDPACIGDIQRLSRLPYTVHEKSGRLAVPLDRQGNPTLQPPDLEFYLRRGLTPRLASAARLSLDAKPQRKGRVELRRARAPVRRLIDLARRGVPLTHRERLAVCLELISLGYKDEEIHRVFQGLPNYKPEKTQYYISHARRRGYRFFGYRKLMELPHLHGEGER